MRKLVLLVVVPTALVVMADVAQAVEASASVDIRRIRLTDRGAIKVVFRAGCEPPWTATNILVESYQNIGDDTVFGSAEFPAYPDPPIPCDSELHRLVAHVRGEYRQSFTSGIRTNLFVQFLVGQPSDTGHTDCREHCVYFRAVNEWQGRLFTGVPVKP